MGGGGVQGEEESKIRRSPQKLKGKLTDRSQPISGGGRFGVQLRHAPASLPSLSSAGAWLCKRLQAGTAPLLRLSLPLVLFSTASC